MDQTNTDSMERESNPGLRLKFIGQWRWIKISPLLDFVPENDKRDPYPLHWDEQIRLFKDMPEHLRRMCLFGIVTLTILGKIILEF